MHRIGGDGDRLHALRPRLPGNDKRGAARQENPTPFHETYIVDAGENAM
jgi:hypothetical protein